MNVCDLSIVIPTFEGSLRVPDVLRCLSKQNTAKIVWEVIIINNGCEERLESVVRDTILNLGMDHIRCSIADEPRLGAGYARLKGCRVARAKIVGFLDDDSLPDENWISEAFSFMENNKKAGASGSYIGEGYSVSPDPGFDEIKPFFAIMKGESVRMYDMKSNYAPPTAGLVVRRDEWVRASTECLLTGRTKDSPCTGEDTEAALRLQKNGWEVWHNPKMRVRHKIEPERLQLQGIKKLFWGIGLGRCCVRMVKPSWYLKPFVLIAFWVKDLLWLIGDLIKRRRMKRVVFFSKLYLGLGCLVSPWVYLRLLIRRALYRSHNS